MPARGLKAMNEEISTILIGNNFPAIGIIGVGAKAFSKNDQVNLRNRTGGNGFRPGLYRVLEVQEAHFKRRPCLRLSVHRAGEQSMNKPAYDVVVIAVE